MLLKRRPITWASPLASGSQNRGFHATVSHAWRKCTLIPIERLGDPTSSRGRPTVPVAKRRKRIRAEIKHSFACNVKADVTQDPLGAVTEAEPPRPGTLGVRDQDRRQDQLGLGACRTVENTGFGGLMGKRVDGTSRRTVSPSSWARSGVQTLLP